MATIKSPQSVRKSAVHHKVERIFLLGVASVLFSPFFPHTANADTLIPAGELCYQLRETLPNGLRQSLKIQLLKDLPNEPGIPVMALALEHGTKTVSGKTLTYYDQLSGTASFIPSDSSQSHLAQVMISLVGTSYGTDDASPYGSLGQWSHDYSMLVQRDDGLIHSARLIGFKSFTAISGKKNEANPKVSYPVNAPLDPITCTTF